MKGLSNITRKEFSAFLKSEGFRLLRTKGGHEIWWKDGLTRPVILQTHIDPIPEPIIKNNLRTIGISREEFLGKI